MYPAITIIVKAPNVIYILYWESVIKNGKTIIRLAKLAPAPNATNIAGSAQQISVDDDANKEKKLTDLSFIVLNTIYLELADRLHFGRWQESSF